MNKDSRDYWSFVEKIQEATDYVQELLTENGDLRRRMTSLEQEKKDLAEKLGTLRGLIHRERPEDPLLHYQLGREGADPADRVPAQTAPVLPARISPPLAAACPQPERSLRPALQAV